MKPWWSHVHEPENLEAELPSRSGDEPSNSFPSAHLWDPPGDLVQGVWRHLPDVLLKFQTVCVYALRVQLRLQRQKLSII